MNDNNVISVFDENNYLYHGTSKLYLNDFIEHGINGKYPDKYYDPLKKLFDIIENDPDIFEYCELKKRYISDFIQRQEKARGVQNTDTLNTFSNIEIWMWHKYNNALEYANKERNNGEGPGFLMKIWSDNKAYILEKYKDKFNVELTNELDKIEKSFFNNTSSNGIVLAFSKDKLIDNCGGECTLTGHYCSENIYTNSDNTFVYYNPIPSNLIYIVDGNSSSEPKKLTKITSEDAKQYIPSINVGAGGKSKKQLKKEKKNSKKTGKKSRKTKKNKFKKNKTRKQRGVKYIKFFI